MSALSYRLGNALTTFIAALPDPLCQDKVALQEIQLSVNRMTLAITGGVHPDRQPEVHIYIRPDRTHYWAITSANGLTFHHACTFRVPGEVDCTTPPVEMVGPESMCAEHAAVRREQNERHDAAMKAWAESPEGIAEARREQAWEARVS